MTTSHKILSVDQSLANSGWVLTLLRPDDTVDVLDYGTIHSRPLEGKSGFEDSFSRGDQLFGAFRALVMHTSPDIIVHEMPVIMGKVASRNREAGTVSVMALRNAAVSLGFRGRILMVQSQHMRKVVTGSVKASKGEIKEAVLGQVKVDGSINEHVSDAIALVLCGVADGSVRKFLSFPIDQPAVGIVR